MSFRLLLSLLVGSAFFTLLPIYALFIVLQGEGVQRFLLDLGAGAVAGAVLSLVNGKTQGLKLVLACAFIGASIYVFAYFVPRFFAGQPFHREYLFLGLAFLFFVLVYLVLPAAGGVALAVWLSSLLARRGQIWERIGARPWRAVASLVGFAVVVAVVMFVVVPLARPLLGFTCDAEEKAALMEFPQYGGRVVEKDIKGPLGGEVLNFPPLQEPPPGCVLGFTDRQATAKQVAAYYEKHLTERGWKVERIPVSPDPQSEAPGDFIYPHVDGTRDDLHYEVAYWPTRLHGDAKMADFSEEALGKEGTGVQVLVYRQ
jgi:signal transduction histidine kinase